MHKPRADGLPKEEMPGRYPSQGRGTRSGFSGKTSDDSADFVDKSVDNRGITVEKVWISGQIELPKRFNRRVWGRTSRLRRAEPS